MLSGVESRRCCPASPADAGRDSTENRLFVEAVLWVERTGLPWRDTPEEFGHWNSVHRRFSRWSVTGVWQRVLDDLARDSDLQHEFLDTTMVRAHQHSAGALKMGGSQALGRSRGGLSTKIHVLAERFGRLARFRLAGGQVNHSTEAIALSQPLPSDMLTADCAYNTVAIVERLQSRGVTPKIPVFRRTQT